MSASVPVLEASSARFRAARERDWLRLDDLLGEIERGRASSLDDDDLFELPVLYRAALSSLSVARETSLDRDLVAYLEALCTRAYFILYGVHAPFLTRLRRFFARDWPVAVRVLWRETVAAALLLLLGAFAAWLLVSGDPGWFHAIVPGDLAQGRSPSASAQELRAAIQGTGADIGFATQLFVHNAQIALLCFALGFAFGVPTVLMLLYNGCVLGAFLAVYGAKGMGLELAAWISIHGSTELFAIALAGAAGLRIGTASAFPGDLTRFASAVRAGRTAAFVMLGAVVMLAVAGLIEGIGRQVVQSAPLRAAIGGGALLAWLLYFYAPRGAAAERDRG